MSLKRMADDLEEDNSDCERPRRSPFFGSLLQQKIPTQSLELPRRDSSQHSVAFQKPSIITTFSYTPDRELVFDNSAIKYFVQPPARADLGYRYSRWTKRPDEKGRLDSLLRAVARSGVIHSPVEAAVSWRGVMCKMIIAPYEERDGWSVNVMHVNGVLYFEEHLTDTQLEAKNNLKSWLRQATYYGYSFESWCTSSENPSPDRTPAWGGDVDTAVQWCGVVKTKLGNTRLILGGEVDCVKGSFTGQTDTFVELKTSVAIRPHNAGDESKFEKKLLKFYFQSFLLGVPEILVGFRSTRGILQQTQTFRTLELPRLVRGKPNAWDPNVCLHWGNELLQNVKTWMTDLAPSDVGRILFTPGTGVTFSRLDDAQVLEVVAGEDRVGFLPNWYYHERVNVASP